MNKWEARLATKLGEIAEAGVVKSHSFHSVDSLTDQVLNTAVCTCSVHGQALVVRGAFETVDE